MGGFTEMFGGGGYEAPEAPKTTAYPSRADADPEEKDIRDAERRKRRAKTGGVNGTLLSAGSLGNVAGGAAGNASGLLGRSITS